MAEFFLALEWFFYGFVLGFIWRPMTSFLTTLVKEIKIARQQWHKGPDQ